MRRKAILFDMDGVLVDVSRSYRRAIEETAAHFTGRSVEPGTVQRYKNTGGFNDDWKLTHAIIREAGVEVSLAEVVTEFQKRYRGLDWDGFIAEEPPLIRTETLERLGTVGRVMGIVTGRPEAEAQWTVDRFGWDRFFALILGMERQEGRGKPDPHCLHQALRMLDASGHPVRTVESVYVGDSVDDVTAARAAGMWALGVVPPYLDAGAHTELLRDRGAHLIIPDVNGLPDIVDRIEELSAVGADATKPTEG